jgi:hypothetical protein
MGVLTLSSFPRITAFHQKFIHSQQKWRNFQKRSKVAIHFPLGEKCIFRISLQIAADGDPVEDFSPNKTFVPLLTDGNMKHHIDMKRLWTRKQA